MPDFKTILAAADDQDKMDLTIAYNAKVTAAKAYQEHPGKATSEDRKFVDADYADLLARMVEKYFPEDTPAPEGERFANRKQAHDWIKAQGYSVSRGKFYNDTNDGFPRIHKDKTISRFEVLQYCQQHDVERRGSPLDLSAEREDAETRKAVADADRSEIKRDQERRELDKNWIPREDADLETCTWLALLRDTTASRLTKSLPALIHATGGHLDRVADGQAILDQAITDACNDISHSGEVDVEILDEDQG